MSQELILNTIAIKFCNFLITILYPRLRNVKLISFIIILEFGEKEIAVLTQHYKECLSTAGVDASLCLPEFLSLKSKLYEDYP